MTTTSAPGKIILLGEHAVVFGKPAVALAIDMRVRCTVNEVERSTVNGSESSERQHPYLRMVLSEHWNGGPVGINIASNLPSGSGLGSSAAVTVSLIGALSRMKGDFVPEKMAREAFDVESKVQGRASPIDTSVSVHGQGVLITPTPTEDLLWEIDRDIRHWSINHCDVPDLTMVVGFTGKKAPTGPLVARVRRYVEHSSFAKDIIDEIGELTVEGLSLIKKRDLVGLGEVMTRNHKLLAILGVSTPELQTLIDAAMPCSYGAKLTGAGGGGSMIALTDEPEKVSRAIRNRGGSAYMVHTGVDGVRVEEMSSDLR